MTEAFEDRAPENIQRGTIFALAAVPLGVILYVVLWNFNVLASIVGFAVAWAALKLYQRGSGAPLSRAGAIRIAIITIGTMLLAVLAGLVSTVATSYSDSPFVYVLTPEFWDLFSAALPLLVSTYTLDIVLAVVFGLFGCFSILRNAFVATSPARPRMPMEPLFPKDDEKS
jgi:hypothetical protein